MKRLLQFPFVASIGLALLISCEKNEPITKMGLCDDNANFYYAGEGKIYLGKQSLSEIYIVFEQEEVTKELAESILSKYSFITNSTIIVGNNNYHQVWVRINEPLTDCIQFNNYLKELNNDDEIYSATPIFYTNENDPGSYFVLLSEVLTKNDKNIISESDFIDYAKTKNLELISAVNSTQYFKVKKVETGFESLKIAQQIYESGIAEYSHPNFIVKIELY